MSQEIIKKYKILAKKSLGQNFLVDDEKVSAISKIIDVENKNIVEVGPGYGALTEKLLAQKPNNLELCELDRDMIHILRDRFGDDTAFFSIQHQDVLEFIPQSHPYNVIANIPYYITSPILRHFLYDLKQAPDQMLILMQKDVGDKILGKGKNKSSVLSLMIEKKCSVSEELFVPKESFLPAPKIESSVLLFKVHEKYIDVDDESFLKFIKIAFLAPRKKLVKNLVSGGFSKEKILDFLCLQGCDENFRGEDADIVFWTKLYQFLIVDR